MKRRPKIPMLRPRLVAIDTRIAPPAPKTVDPIYSTARYRRWRQAVIERAGGRCQDPTCKDPTRVGMTLFADHIIELRDGGQPFDLANGMARCGSCHTSKTGRARGERARRTWGAE